MEKRNIADLLVELQATKDVITEKIKAYEEGLVAEKKYDEMSGIEAEISKYEVKYASVQREIIFAECMAEENPMLAAVKRHHYDILRHKKITEGDVVTGMELVARSVTIDLVAFCKYAEFDTAWANKVSRLNKLFALRTAKELGISGTEFKLIDDSFYTTQLLSEIKNGKTPTSNTQLLKALQDAIDSCLYIETTSDKGEKMNSMRGKAVDVNYILLTQGKRGKAALSVGVVNLNNFHKLFADIMYRIATDSVYTLDYKKITEKDKEKAERDAKKAALAEAKKNEAEAGVGATKEAAEVEPNVVDKVVKRTSKKAETK